MVNWDNSANLPQQTVTAASNRVRRLTHELKQAQQDLRRAAYYKAVNNPQVAKSLLAEMEEPVTKESARPPQSACDCAREKNFHTFNAEIETENLRLKRENADLKERLHKIERSTNYFPLGRI